MNKQCLLIATNASNTTIYSSCYTVNQQKRIVSLLLILSSAHIDKAMTQQEMTAAYYQNHNIWQQ